MFKTLYARLVLWLILPALEARESELAERARRKGDEARNRINAALRDRGSLFSRSMRPVTQATQSSSQFSAPHSQADLGVAEFRNSTSMPCLTHVQLLADSVDIDIDFRS